MILYYPFFLPLEYNNIICSISKRAKVARFGGFLASDIDFFFYKNYNLMRKEEGNAR